MTLLHWLIPIIVGVIASAALIWAAGELIASRVIRHRRRRHLAARVAQADARQTRPLSLGDLVISPEAEELIRQRVRDAIRHPGGRPGLRVVPDCERCRTGRASLPCACRADCGDSACLGGAEPRIWVVHGGG